jgi:formylmethanofuran dehydrogenase subunit B
MKTSKPASQLNATCPACGLLCDDITISINAKGSLRQISVENCPKSTHFFSQNTPSTSAKIKGKPATLEAAIQRAGEILKNTKKPILSGLSTDLAGFRASYKMAEQMNADMMHMHANSSLRNIKVLQSVGWQTTTLTEVKNRADVILFIGTDAVQHNPRFFERTVWVEDAMFTDPHARSITYLGGLGLDTSYGLSPKGKKPEILPCDIQHIPEVTAALRAMVLGMPLKATEIAGIAIADLQKLVDRLKAAKYAVIVWNAKELNFPHAELTIQNITETAVALNQSTRAAGLALGGSDGDTTAHYAHTWLNGLTLAEHDISQYDAMIWINSFSPEKKPPSFSHPTIVFGHIDSAFDQAPEVFIPVATPGIDCTGLLFRVDSSVVMPLKKCRETDLPTLANVMQLIEANLEKV